MGQRGSRGDFLMIFDGFEDKIEYVFRDVFLMVSGVTFSSIMGGFWSPFWSHFG